MEKDDPTMTTKAKSKRKPTWPASKPLPAFKSYADEVKFWRSYDFDDGKPEEWEELVFEPGATRHPRKHVYRVRFDDREMASLQALAKRRGAPASVVLRELVAGALRRPPGKRRNVG
jgi:hypothetical protein